MKKATSYFFNKKFMQSGPWVLVLSEDIDFQLNDE